MLGDAQRSFILTLQSPKNGQRQFSSDYMKT